MKSLATVFVTLLVGLSGACADETVGDTSALDTLADTSAADTVADTAQSDTAPGDTLQSDTVADNSVRDMDLLRLREEEKLARDVYLRLAESWDLMIFANISQSEQSHMDQVGAHIVALGLVDPVVDDQVGAFTAPEFTDLFASLVASGESSLVEALRVGATIEDLDIYDIAGMISRTDDPAILATYRALECGSRNHMRAFIGQLDRNGATYEAQYISSADFEAIITTPREGCEALGQ